jgi:4'-phosphopantetheinyl transferase
MESSNRAGDCQRMPSLTIEELPGDEAHLWVARPESARDPDLRSRYQNLSSVEERQKCARFRFDKDREICLVTRALLRTTLSRYSGVPPEAFRFVANEYGRPEVDEPREARWLRFNLSHTTGLVACLVAREREVGVDVEDRERTGELLDVADRFFSPYEVRALRAQPMALRLDRFFLYWTLKESYIKARGMGLAIPLSQFSFELDEPRDAGIGIRFNPELRDDPDRWQFSALSFGRRHAIASAVERRPSEAPRLVLREAVPLAS